MPLTIWTVHLESLPINQLDQQDAKTFELSHELLASFSIIDYVFLLCLMGMFVKKSSKNPLTFQKVSHKVILGRRVNRNHIGAPLVAGRLGTHKDVLNTHCLVAICDTISQAKRGPADLANVLRARRRTCRRWRTRRLNFVQRRQFAHKSGVRIAVLTRPLSRRHSQRQALTAAWLS